MRAIVIILGFVGLFALAVWMGWGIISLAI